MSKGKSLYFPVLQNCVKELLGTTSLQRVHSGTQNPYYYCCCCYFSQVGLA